MIKRSAILLLFFALGSFSLLLFTSYSTASPSSTPVKEKKRVKCSGGCKKKGTPPLPWNIISPAMVQHQG